MKPLIVMDGHCDTALKMWKNGSSLRSNTGHISLERAAKLDGYAQFFAFFTTGSPDTIPPEKAFSEMWQCFTQQVQQNGDRVAICSTPAEAETAIGQGKCAAFLSVEGSEAIGCDPGRLEQLRNMGFRMVSLTWNHVNALAGSCMTGEGLTQQGREFCRRAQKLGMALDVSHLSERAFWDMCELAEKPIVASHSNSKALCGHVRNLTDDQFRAICQLGGTAGINMYGIFLTEETPTFDDVYAHIDHFLELGGADHVALGGDLDGCSGLPTGFTGVDDYRKLAEYLESKGYDSETLQKIFYKSLWEVLTKCSM